MRERLRNVVGTNKLLLQIAISVIAYNIYYNIKVCKFFQESAKFM